MHNFDSVYHTDKGIKKQQNEDSLLLNGIAAGDKEILLAVICDGLGGMSKGELASATIVRAFSEWLKAKYIYDNDKQSFEKIKLQWRNLIEDCNYKLMEYGQRQGIELGTTVTALIVHSTGSYLIGHVGDTRAYCLSDKIEQLTEDHTLVGREIKRGLMTKEQAMKDARQNVLLQCIGVNQYVEPQFLEGYVEAGEAFLLCSDGFRHKVSEEELWKHLAPGRLNDSDSMQKELVELVELNKQRKETDNISAIYIKRK